MAFTSASADATQKGAESEISAAKPPIAGPAMNPSAAEAPNMP